MLLHGDRGEPRGQVGLVVAVGLAQTVGLAAGGSEPVWFCWHHVVRCGCWGEHCGPGTQSPLSQGQALGWATLAPAGRKRGVKSQRKLHNLWLRCQDLAGSQLLGVWEDDRHGSWP